MRNNFYTRPSFFLFLIGFIFFNFNLSAANDTCNIIYSRCNWEVDPSVNYIEGFITYYFIPETINFDSLILDMANPLVSDSVIYHQSNAGFNHQSDLLSIFFPGILALGQKDSITIFYHGVPVPTGNGSFVQANHAGVPVIYTMSEPFGARDWWPCKQDLNDKIDSIDIFVNVPQEYRTASNGNLISEDSTSSFRTSHWKSNYPIASYLVAIGVTNYSVSSEKILLSNGDSLLILNYLYPESVSLAAPTISLTGDYIHLYDSLTITYPFYKEKYGHAQFGFGGGMEHQTMSFIGSFGSELIAHELAHQWFGDAVTCGSWSDIWLHEGFATYFSGLTVEFMQPASEWKAWKASTLAKATSVNTGSVYCHDTTNMARIFDSALSYNKGSCFLNMLRWKLGDAAFFEGIKNFLLDTSIVYNYARTLDLKTHFEYTSGINLDQFFNEWFYGSGFPSYSLEWERKGNDVDINIFQHSSDSASAFFHVPVPIKLVGENKDTMVIADLSYSGELFSFQAGFRVEEIQFDPDYWILSANNSVIEKENPFTDDLEIFPNPGNDNFTIHTKKPELFAQSISIVDLLGKEIFSMDYSDNISKRTISLYGKSSGAYFFRIETSNGVVVKKVMLEK
jgi:hypothetical protein